MNLHHYTKHFNAIIDKLLEEKLTYRQIQDVMQSSLKYRCGHYCAILSELEVELKDQAKKTGFSQSYCSVLKDYYLKMSKEIDEL